MSQVPLKDMLRALDTNDLGFYQRLDKEQAKAFSPWLAMRYASSANGSDAYHYLLMVNSLVNVDFNTLRNHPHLQWQLLAVCGTGSVAFHPWVPPGKKKKKDRIIDFMRKLYPAHKKVDLELMIELADTNELKQLAVSAGLDDKEIKELFKK